MLRVTKAAVPLTLPLLATSGAGGVFWLKIVKEVPGCGSMKGIDYRLCSGLLIYAG